MFVPLVQELQTHPKPCAACWDMSLLGQLNMLPGLHQSNMLRAT